ncbi:MAG: hypothetical protein ACTTI3_07010 [Treponema sp.]
MKCRFCGKDIKPIGSGLTSSYGQLCRASPTKKHVALSDGVHCIHCGRSVKSLGNYLVTEYGQKCRESPTEKHILQ